MNFASVPCSAQNLVRNGSMEVHSQCPYNYGQIDFANWWLTPSGNGGSSEYFHTCGIMGPVDPRTPKNGFGYQIPFHGKAYAGAIYYIHNVVIQDPEFVECEMKQILFHDSCYLVSFHVCNAEESNYGIETFGLYISDSFIGTGSAYADTIIPQIPNNNGVVSDTTNWTHVTGVYKALGGEKYLTIGNFNISRPINYQLLPWGNINGGTYFYIDAVSIYPCNSPIYHATIGMDTSICLGESIVLGTLQVPDKYLHEYEFLWYEIGKEADTLATTEQLLTNPIRTTTYILKQTDFKYDVTYDTVTVTVKDCDAPDQLRVFPNPTTDKLHFVFNHPAPIQSQILIYDLTGRKIKILSIQQERTEFVFDFFGLPSGMYLYSYQTSNGQLLSGKFVKTE